MRIVFDSVITAEIDFSGLHIIILYAQQGVDYWLEVNRDPYILPNLVGIDPEIDMRSVAKSLLLVAINSNDEAQTYRAFRRQAKSGSREKKLTDSQLSAILVGLKQLHEPIADSFASGAGINLMYVDSQITAKIIERFTYHYKCPILTIHDSYIVPFSYDYILKEEMQKAFEAVTGISGARVEHTTAYYDFLDYEGADWSEILPSCYDFSPPSQRHLEEVKLFRVFKDKPQSEDWVSDRTSFY